MTGHERIDQAAELSGTIIVQLEPYRERRRVRSFAAGLLLGYLAGAWILPAAAELVDVLIDTAEPSANGAAGHQPAATTAE